MFQDLKSLLESSLKQKGINQAVEAVLVAEFVRGVVGELLGSEAVKGLRQVFLQDQTLYIKASSSVLASELKLRQNDILRALSNRFSGKQYSLKIFG